MKNNQEFINKGKFVCAKCARQIMNERAKTQAYKNRDFERTCNHEFDHADEVIDVGWLVTSIRVNDTFAVFDENNKASIWTLDELVAINPNLKTYKGLLDKFNSMSRGEIFYQIDDSLEGTKLEEALQRVAHAKGSRAKRTIFPGGDTHIFYRLAFAQSRAKIGLNRKNKYAKKIKRNINDVSYGRGVNVEKNTRQQLHIDVVKTVKEHLKFK